MVSFAHNLVVAYNGTVCKVSCLSSFHLMIGDITVVEHIRCLQKKRKVTSKRTRKKAWLSNCLYSLISGTLSLIHFLCMAIGLH